MKGTRLFWQTILVVAFAAVGTLSAAQTGDALKPRGDFKHWYLVHSTLITKDDNKLGLIAGVHLIYVNAAGLDRLKRGGSTPYPDGTMFSDDVRDYSAAGVYVQGATRKGGNAFVMRITPSRFVLIMRTICSSVSPSSGPAIPYPALLNTTSTPPIATVLATASLICAESVTSSGSTVTSRNSLSSVPFCASLPRIVAITRHPLAENSSTEARPSPEEVPVMKIVF